MRRGISIVIGATFWGLTIAGCSRVSLPVSLSPSERVDLAHNKPHLIQKELLDPKLLMLIGRAKGLSAGTVSDFKVVRNSATGELELQQFGMSMRALNVLSEGLTSYVQERQQGHTREFMLASLTNRARNSAISDPDLCALLQRESSLPLTFLKKSQAGTFTNKAGEVASRVITYSTVNGATKTNETIHIPRVDEVCRWTSYVLVDGAVAWRYRLRFNADSSLREVSCQRMDAIEVDPKYRDIIEKVESEVRAEMQKQGSFGKFGSVHTFWDLKKERLKAKGINWHTPRELNPNIHYD